MEVEVSNQPGVSYSSDGRDHQPESEIESPLIDCAKNILLYCGLEGKPLQAALSNIRMRLRKKPGKAVPLTYVSKSYY